MCTNNPENPFNADLARIEEGRARYLNFKAKNNNSKQFEKQATKTQKIPVSNLDVEKPSSEISSFGPQRPANLDLSRLENNRQQYINSQSDTENFNIPNGPIKGQGSYLKTSEQQRTPENNNERRERSPENNLPDNNGGIVGRFFKDRTLIDVAGVRQVSFEPVLMKRQINKTYHIGHIDSVSGISRFSKEKGEGFSKISQSKSEVSSQMEQSPNFSQRRQRDYVAIQEAPSPSSTFLGHFSPLSQGLAYFILLSTALASFNLLQRLVNWASSKKNK